MAAHHSITRVIMFFQSRPISYGLTSLGPGTPKSWSWTSWVLTESVMVDTDIMSCCHWQRLSVKFTCLSQRWLQQQTVEVRLSTAFVGSFVRVIFKAVVVMIYQKRHLLSKSKTQAAPAIEFGTQNSRLHVDYDWLPKEVLQEISKWHSYSNCHFTASVITQEFHHTVIIIKNANDNSDTATNKRLQGHFTMSTNTQQTCWIQCQRPAEVSHWKLDRKRKVFSSWRNVDSNEAALTEEGKSSVPRSWCTQWHTAVTIECCTQWPPVVAEWLYQTSGWRYCVHCVV